MYVSARALPVRSGWDVRGNALAQGHHLEAHRVTIVQGNSARVKAWGQGLLGTPLAVCNTKAYAAPKHSKRERLEPRTDLALVKTNPQPTRLALSSSGGKEGYRFPASARA